MSNALDVSGFLFLFAMEIVIAGITFLFGYAIGRMEDKDKR